MVATRGQRIRSRLLHRYRAAQERAHVLAQRGWLDKPISAMPLIFGEPAVIVRDSFNRNDDALSLGTPETGPPAWTAQTGTWSILAGQARHTDLGASRTATVDVGIADCEIEALVNLGGSATDAGLTFRWGAGPNKLVCFVEGFGASRGLILYRVEAGGWNSIGTYGFVTDNSAWYRLTLRLSGAQIEVYLDDVLRITATDSFQQTITVHGLITDNTADNTVCRFDDFLVKRLSG